MGKKTSELHFDSLSEEYDWFKEQNWYYYSNLKKIIRKNIKDTGNKKVLEVGCGTGSLLSFINPREGVGIDISRKMISLAKKKHKHRKNLKFFHQAGEAISVSGTFDVIIMIDVVEHLNNVPATIRMLEPKLAEGGTFLITTANPLWAPFLWLGEKMGLKMEEGPHTWTGLRKLEILLRRCGLKIVHAGTEMIFPFYIFGFSAAMNRLGRTLPLLRKAGLIQVIAAVKRSSKHR